jgi:hypothetical protein
MTQKDMAPHKTPTRATGKKAKPIPQDLLDSLEYRDGHLWWSKRTGPSAKMDRPAGSVYKGTNRRYVAHKSLRYLASRVVWTMHKGAIPDGLYVDHINGNTTDDRLENLRLASPQDNNINRIGRSRTGLKNVYHYPIKNKPWYVSLVCDGKRTGKSFKTKEEAANYAKAMREKHHGKFANHKSEVTL